MPVDLAIMCLGLAIGLTAGIMSKFLHFRWHGQRKRRGKFREPQKTVRKFADVRETPSNDPDQITLYYAPATVEVQR